MSDPGQAVFLSYASQDAEAAKRIADALRASGVEVWFDQNELVGGDAWDQKIRKQIGECALFVPIISANTQARREGYFRLEWKLAVQRTHMIADGTPFLLPVVIDDTREGDALVPAEFKGVQWTRLRAGETPAAFCARVQKLLEGGHVPERTAVPSAAPGRRPAWMRYGWVAVGLAFAIVYAVRPWWSGKREAAGKPVPAAPAAATTSEAQRLVAKAREILNQGDEMNRENYALAEELLKRAEAADVTEASAWSLHAWMSADMYRYGLDRNEARLAQIQAQANRAMALAPETLDAQLAQLRAQSAARQTPEQVAAKQLELAGRFPDDPRTYRIFGLSFSKDGTTVQMLKRALERWPNDGRLQGDFINTYLLLGEYAEAEAFAEKVARGPTSARVLAAQAFIRLWWRGDAAAAAAGVEQWPAWFLNEDRGVGMAAIVALMNRTPERAIELLRRLPRDYIHDAFCTGPRSAFLALAHEAAGQPESAAAEWRTALQVCDRELAAVTGDAAALHWKAWALARLGDRAAAMQIFRVLVQRQVTIEGLPQVTGGLTGLALLLGDKEEALREIGRLGNYEPGRTRPPSRGLFDLNPVFDPLRGDPRFQRIRDAALAPKAETPDPKPARPQEVDEKSVAVLAFANLSDDKANEYFSDGISEELLNVLAKVPGLKVSARTSAFYFKGKEVPIPEIAKQLGVAYVVEGSVRKAGDKVRITAQLIKAADGFHVWSDTFTRDLKDIFAVQDEIAGLIAQNLQLKLVSASPGAIDPALYERLLEARAAAGRENNQDWRRAITLYQDIVTRNPRAAAAWGEMARVYVQLARFGGMPLGEGMREARRAAQQALEIDPNLAIGHVALGWVQRTADWDWRGALRSFNRARELAPDDCAIMGDAAVLLLNIGQIDEAVRLARAGAARDPLNARAQASLGYVLALAGRSEEALPPIRRAIELAPAIDEAHSHLARALLRLGRIDEAEQAANLEPHDAYRWNVQSLILAKRGRTEESERVFNQFLAKYRDEMPGYIAVSLAMRGQTDQAFEWIERAIALRDSSIPWFKTNSYLESLRSDPRWDKFLHRLGLADEQLR